MKEAQESQLESHVALTLMQKIVDAISSDLELEHVAQRVAELVTSAVGADVCFVHLVDHERNILTLIGATPPFDKLRGTVHLAIGDGIAGWVAQHGEPTVVHDKWNDPRYRYLPELRGQDFSELISIPMIRPGTGVVGVFNVHWKEERKESANEVEVLQDVARIFAGAVENAQLLAKLANRERELSRFAALTIEAQEAERRRIAADFHDVIGQGLLSLLFHLDAAAGNSKSASKEIAAAKKIARDTLDEVKSAIWKLRPGVLDDLGLVAGLESLAKSIPQLEVTVEADDVDLEQHVETALFRICQEALQNAVKHSDADAAQIRLKQNEKGIRLTITDNGIGFDPHLPVQDRSYGLIGMRERSELIGGKLDIVSRLGNGTRVSVRIPSGKV